MPELQRWAVPNTRAPFGNPLYMVALLLGYSHPEVDRIWGIKGIHWGSFKGCILSNPGWLYGKAHLRLRIPHVSTASVSCVANSAKGLQFGTQIARFSNAGTHDMATTMHPRR